MVNLRMGWKNSSSINHFPSPALANKKAVRVMDSPFFISGMQT
jgi:hypothetical protein